MSVLTNVFRGREPTTVSASKSNHGSVIQMVTTYGEYYYAWDGKLYNSDIIRACIRPKVKSIGKLQAKHSRKNEEGSVINPEPRLRFLLEEPNPYMTGQMLQEKLTTQLMLNGNAFALIVRDRNGYPEAIYPIPCISAEAIYDSQADLYLKFTYTNGNTSTFAYDDIIHLRSDFNDHEIFGSSPAPALTALMECVGTIDQGIVKAVKNSNVIRWLLEFNSSMRPEDIKNQTKAFAENYLNYETETFGVAAVDQKVNAKQVQPNDYVPNALVADRLTERVYSFFNTNKDIVQSSYTEDQWNAYYESEIEPLSIQLANVYTIKLFTRRERVLGNRVLFEAANLAYSSMSTKLKLTDFLDRGIMNANEIREILSLPAIPGGDEYVRRLDTAPIAVGSEPKQEEQPAQEAEEKSEEGGVEDAENRRKRITDPERL